MYWQGAVTYDRDSILVAGAIVLSPALATVTLSANIDNEFLTLDNLKVSLQFELTVSS